MYKPGDDKLEVRELLVKAFASAWEAGDKTVDRDTYINSSINVIDSLQVGPEMIYGEEGQGLLEGELDHLPDLLRADGAWVYYAVPAENYFILTWMEDSEKAAAKVASDALTHSVSPGTAGKHSRHRAYQRDQYCFLHFRIPFVFLLCYTE